MSDTLAQTIIRCSRLYFPPAEPAFPTNGDHRLDADVNYDNGTTLRVSATFSRSANVSTFAPPPLTRRPDELYLVASLTPQFFEPFELNGITIPETTQLYIGLSFEYFTRTYENPYFNNIRNVSFYEDGAQSAARVDLDWAYLSTATAGTNTFNELRGTSALHEFMLINETIDALPSAAAIAISDDSRKVILVNNKS